MEELGEQGKIEESKSMLKLVEGMRSEIKELDVKRMVSCTIWKEDSCLSVLVFFISLSRESCAMCTSAQECDSQPTI